MLLNFKERSVAQKWVVAHQPAHRIAKEKAQKNSMGQKESSPFKTLLDQLDKDRENGREGGFSHLNFEGTRIDEVTARTLADYMRRRDMSWLKHLHLGGCGITYTSFYYLVEALCARTPGLTRLDMTTQAVPPEGNPLGTKSANFIGTLLNKCSYLTHLRLGNCNLDCDNAVSIAEAVMNHQSLQTLDLSYNHIGDTGAEKLGYMLQHNRSLTGLQLWKNRISSEGAEGIAAGLVINSHLQWLGLGCNDIGDDGVCSITEALTTNIEGSSLVWLGLGSNRIGDKGATALAELLASGMTSIDEDEGGEGTACVLQSLGLGGNEITDEGAVQLAQAMDKNEVLKSIGLSHNRIGDEGAQAIADMLRNNSSLEKLSLSANDITDEGGEPLIGSLTQNTSLMTLLLAQNPISDQVCDRCSEVFSKFNLTVQVIDLNQTRISRKAFRKLVLSLKNSDAKLKAVGGSLPPDTFDKNTQMPTSGNLLEVTIGKPPPSSLLFRRKLFDGVQVTERAHGLLSLPTSALTPKALGRRNTLIQKRKSVIERQRKESNQRFMANFELKPIDISDSDEEKELAQTSGIEEPDNGSLQVLPTHGADLKGFQIPLGGYSPNVRKNKKVDALELKPVEFQRNRQGRERKVMPRQQRLIKPEALEESDSEDEEKDQNEGILGNRMSWYNELPLPGSKPKPKEQHDIIEEETPFTDTDVGRTNDGEGKRKSVRFSQEEGRWIEEDDDDDDDDGAVAMATAHKRGVTFSDTVEEEQVHTQRQMIVGDEPSDEGAGRVNISWQFESQNDDWTTLDTMEIPQNVSLIDTNKKNRKRSVVRMSEGYSDDESEVEVYDSEGSSDREGENDNTSGDNGGHRQSQQLVNDEREFIVPKRDHHYNDDGDERPIDDKDLSEVIPRSPVLSVSTKDRPKFKGRRLPSPSPSSGSISQYQENEESSNRKSTFSETLNPMERLREEESGDDDDTEQPEDNELLPISLDEVCDEPEILLETPSRDQWINALKKRVEQIQSGHSLQIPFRGVISATKDYYYVTTSAKFPCNVSKNRESAPLSPNKSRIKLQMAEEDMGSDYINANYLGSPSYKKSYILAQWPLQQTVSDFWRMIWEQRVGLVVVLGSLGDSEEIFWPGLNQDQLHSLVVGDKWSENALYVNTWKAQNIAGVGTEELSVQVHSYNDMITETLKLVHYKEWPTNGVPRDVEAVARIFHWSLAIRQAMILGSPMVVVSADKGGIGGSFVAVSVAYELLQTQDPVPFDNDINILDSVYKGLLELRPGLLEDQKQYDFSHLLLEKILLGDCLPIVEESIDSSADAHHRGSSASANQNKKKTGKGGFFNRKKKTSDTPKNKSSKKK